MLNCRVANVYVIFSGFDEVGFIYSFENEVVHDSNDVPILVLIGILNGVSNHIPLK
jgi:hypothetical protein